MSLFKAFANTAVVRDAEEILGDFKTVIESIAMHPEKVSPEDVANLVKYYAEYSSAYLTKVAVSLVEPKGIDKTMKFMNCYIAEACSLSNIMYFHREGTFSIIDKAVQEALATGGVVSMDKIKEIIEEVQATYAEEQE